MGKVTMLIVEDPVSPYSLCPRCPPLMLTHCQSGGPQGLP